jgi:hypothetical protein
MASQIAREIRQITVDKEGSMMSLDWEWQKRLYMSEVQRNTPTILDQHNESHDNNILTYEEN